MRKRKYTKHLFATMIVVLVAMSGSSTILAESGAPKIVGDWKLNIAKSKFGSGPPLKGRNLHWEWSGDTLKHTAETIEATGDRTLAHFEGKFDDKDYGVFQNGGKTPARYVRLKRLDDYNIEITSRKDGKDLTTFRHSISKDGKTDTVTQTGDTRQGGSGTDLLVLERQ
jgi:hypothetical protein